MEKIKVGFYGYGTRALDALMEHPDFTVLHFLTPESRICPEVYEAEKRYREYFPMVKVAGRRDLAQKIAEIGDVSCFVMNASPIILDDTILGRMDFYNIHPGSLKNNRGHHPHLWSVLLDEKETEINLHRVTTEIDLGEVIGTVRVPVLPDDTSRTLLDRTEDQIPELLTALAAYLRGERPALGVVREGGYRRKMTYEDYRFDPEKDTLADMDRKIRARAMHSGGFFAVDGRRIYADRILSGFERGGAAGAAHAGAKCGGAADAADMAARGAGARGADGPALLEPGDGTVVLTRGGERAVFGISKITDEAGVLLWKKEEDGA